ncbi:MAG: hypothetical protein ACRCY8_11110, partial [Dermatophilaceae bacterium]
MPDPRDPDCFDRSSWPVVPEEDVGGRCGASGEVVPSREPGTASVGLEPGDAEPAGVEPAREVTGAPGVVPPVVAGPDIPDDEPGVAGPDAPDDEPGVPEDVAGPDAPDDATPDVPDDDAEPDAPDVGPDAPEDVPGPDIPDDDGTPGCPEVQPVLGTPFAPGVAVTPVGDPGLRITVVTSGVVEPGEPAWGTPVEPVGAVPVEPAPPDMGGITSGEGIIGVTG